MMSWAVWPRGTSCLKGREVFKAQPSTPSLCGLYLGKLDGTVSRLCHCGYAESVTLLAYYDYVLTWLTDHKLIHAK